MDNDRGARTDSMVEIAPALREPTLADGHSLGVREICEALWDLESRHQLLDWRIHGVTFWKLIRMNTYVHLARSLQLFGLPQRRPRSLSQRVLRELPVWLYSAFARNPFSGRSDGAYLLVGSGRYSMVGGEVVDSYFYAIRRELGSEAVRVLRASLGSEPSDLSMESHGSVEFVGILAAMARRVHPLRIARADAMRLEQVAEDLRKLTGVSIDLRSWAAKAIGIFNAQNSFYRTLLGRHVPRCIFLTCSYGREPLIAAAQEAGIPVVEAQHGTISKYHMGYHFPERTSVDYFPDIFLAFGDYWIDRVRLPLGNSEVIPFGYPLFSDTADHSWGKKEKVIVFLSQGTIGADLSKLACELVGRSCSYRVVYKLHPGEVHRWREDYPWLNAAERAGELNVRDQQHPESLYALQSRAEYQCGVYSTALFEGLALGCKTILVDLPGLEYMADLIRDQLVFCVDSVNEIDQILSSDSAPANRPPSNYFFRDPPLSLDVVLEAIENRGRARHHIP